MVIVGASNPLISSVAAEGSPAVAARIKNTETCRLMLLHRTLTARNRRDFSAMKEAQTRMAALTSAQAAYLTGLHSGREHLDEFEKKLAAAKIQSAKSTNELSPEKVRVRQLEAIVDGIKKS